jgi:hypothetical protein
MYCWTKRWAYRTNVVLALLANHRRFIRQVGQSCLEVPSGQLGKVPDFLIAKKLAHRNSVPVVSAFATTSGDSVERKVERVSLVAGRWGLPTISEGFGSTDTAANAAFDSVFEPEAASAPCVVQRLLPERNVPEVMTYAFPLKRSEGRVDVAQVTCRRTVKGDEEFAALPAASWAQYLGEFSGESEAVQVSVTHGHRTADFYLFGVFPDARG